MGQAFRRAAGRLRTSSLDTTSSSTPSRSNNAFDHRPPPVSQDTVDVYQRPPASNDEGSSKNNVEVSETRDPQYEAMLGQMVGRITTKPGGKSEMGEAFVAEKPSRPLPRVRNITPETGRYEERLVAPGTLNVAQLRHVILLHQGKAEDHTGPMGVKEISERFRVDELQMQRILKFVSLPPEDNVKQRHEDDM